mmetsp:Transcript_61215/g.197238  ORF Transcript_61215/g.197238 Transcript_61215/m.197238 type:complete len:339 (+) Transcript_61215:1-1017(+)
MDFSWEVAESLPALRQDAQNLQRRPARPESEKAVIDAVRLAKAASGTGREASSFSGDTVAAVAPDPARPSCGWGQGHIPAHAWGTGAAVAVDVSIGSSEPDGFTRVGRGGRGKGLGELRAQTYAPESRQMMHSHGFESGAGKGSCGSSASAASAYPSKGKASCQGKAGARGIDSSDDVIPLPPRAASMLQRDRSAAAVFHRDLKTFAGRFKVAAELRGLDAVVMRPMGFVHQEAIRQARAELQGLLSFYFPECRRPDQRRVELRVDDEHGAGIEMTPSAHGYRIDHVEDFPGQDFVPGEVIIEVNGRPLAGLSEEAMEDTFAECFGNGASLCIIKCPA